MSEVPQELSPREGYAAWAAYYDNDGNPLIPLEGLLVLALVALAVNLAATRAIHRPQPAMVQKTVKAGIFSLVWIDVGLVAAVRGPQVALAVAILWLPAYLLGRWLYST